MGKSAIAIEVVRRLYESQKFLFVISLSAKSKIWHKHTRARTPNFSGYREFLREIATVLEIDLSDDTEELKTAIINTISGVEGLLLVDNLEEIEGNEIFEFLSYGVPAPVKMLVTSRISRGLGAKTISIEALEQDEALRLLEFELRENDYTRHITEDEKEDMLNIVKSVGRLPLAIKWVASLASRYQSLSQLFKKLEENKDSADQKEFLNFCFSTMYEALSDNAKDVAALCPYLKDHWNAITLSHCLKIPENIVKAAIIELENYGLIFANISNQENAYHVLPLTMEFLNYQWSRNWHLRQRIENNLAAIYTSSEIEGDIF